MRCKVSLVRSGPAGKQRGSRGQCVNGSLGVIVFVHCQSVQHLASSLCTIRKISAEDASNVLLDLNPKAVRTNLGEAKKHFVVKSGAFVLEEVTNTSGLRFGQERINADKGPFQLVQSL